MTISTTTPGGDNFVPFVVWLDRPRRRGPAYTPTLPDDQVERLLRPRLSLGERIEAAGIVLFFIFTGGMAGIREDTRPSAFDPTAALPHRRYRREADPSRLIGRRPPITPWGWL